MKFWITALSKNYRGRFSNLEVHEPEICGLKGVEFKYIIPHPGDYRKERNR
jgi:hypothetical protein